MLEARQAKGLTQLQLAEQRGVERTYLAKLEAGMNTLLLDRSLRLLVRLGAQDVALLRRTGSGGISCEYTSQTLAEHPPGVPLLSCSLPVRRGRQAAWPFVTGLLPEGHHRTSMSRLAGVDGHDALGMLARFGRDVA